MQDARRRRERFGLDVVDFFEPVQVRVVLDLVQRIGGLGHHGPSVRYLHIYGRVAEREVVECIFGSFGTVSVGIFYEGGFFILEEYFNFLIFK